MDAQVVDVRMTVRPGDLETEVRSGGIESLDVSVPVERLVSGEPAMDANLRSALASDRFPEVRFHLRSYDVSGASGLLLHGSLTIAGTSRDVDMPATIDHVPGGLRFTGREPVRMSDYGVTPPVFLGVLRTADEATVGFRVDVLASK